MARRHDRRTPLWSGADGGEGLQQRFEEFLVAAPPAERVALDRLTDLR
jgi:hypothetical protein